MATVLAGVVLAGAALLLNDFVSHRLIAQVDRQLADKLDKARLLDPAAAVRPSVLGGAVHFGLGIYGEPIYVWELDAGGAPDPSPRGVPPLPGGGWSRTRPSQVTVTDGSTQLRLLSVPYRGGLLVAGENLAELAHVESILDKSELASVPLILIVVFVASLLIGLRSAAPIEQARRRQLEFTSDASHELRTPLSVIEAELSLAGDTPTDEVLVRIGQEAKRLRRIVDDLLWLARLDTVPPSPGPEAVDVATIVEACAERFGAVATRRGTNFEVATLGAEPATIVAPAEWIDRLAGALIDNACKYAGDGGAVRVEVGTAAGRAVFAVEDSGPGIPEEMRGRVFDRFRRGPTTETGHGLGLAIADSVVRTTGGRWQIGERTEGGGTRMEVSWPRR